MKQTKTITVSVEEIVKILEDYFTGIGCKVNEVVAYCSNGNRDEIYCKMQTLEEDFIPVSKVLLDKELLKRKIESLDIKDKAKQSLQANGIETVEQLVACSGSQVSRFMTHNVFWTFKNNLQDKYNISLKE